MNAHADDLVHVNIAKLSLAKTKFGQANVLLVVLPLFDFLIDEGLLFGSEGLVSGAVLEGHCNIAKAFTARHLCWKQAV